MVRAEVIVCDGDGSGEARDASVVSFGAIFFAIRGEAECALGERVAKAEAADLGVGEVLDAHADFAFRGADAEDSFGILVRLRRERLAAEAEACSGTGERPEESSSAWFAEWRIGEQWRHRMPGGDHA